MTGELDPYSDEGFARAMGFLGFASAGALPAVRTAALRGAPKAAEMLAIRSPELYDPPALEPRSFARDYPVIERFADDAGNLARDIEGRPLTAEYVVGRRMVGGKDQAFPPAQLDALTEATTGARSAVAPLRGRAVGEYEKRPIGRDELEALPPHERYSHPGFQGRVFLRKGLSPEQRPRVHTHETGHVLNDVSGTDRVYKAGKHGRPIPFGEIPVTEGMAGELPRVYRDLNGGRMPEDFGYAGDDVRSELMAEAIRAYMADPNYFKAVAPKTAAAIRAAVNDKPALNKIIQFNALGLPPLPMPRQEKSLPPDFWRLHEMGMAA
jgi:hypothetical protein